MKSNLLNLPISGEYLQTIYGRKTVDRLLRGGPGTPKGQLRKPSPVSSNKTEDTFWKSGDIIRWISLQEDLPQHFSVTSYVRESPESPQEINYRPQILDQIANMSVPVLIKASGEMTHLEFLLNYANLGASLQYRALAAAYAYEFLKTWFAVRPEAKPYATDENRLAAFATYLGNDVLRSSRHVTFEINATSRRFRLGHPTGFKMLALRDEDTNIPAPYDAIQGTAILGDVEMAFYLAHSNDVLKLRDHLPPKGPLEYQLRSLIRQHVEPFGISHVYVRLDNY